jgi:hypothetical protein
MKRVNGTLAKNLLGEVLDDACGDLVLVERRGKPTVALMAENEARTAVLSAYAVGAMSRSVAMNRLGLTWYGELIDALSAANLKVAIDAETAAAMDRGLDALLEQRAP